MRLIKLYWQVIVLVILLGALLGILLLWILEPAAVPTPAQLQTAATVGGCLLLFAACSGLAAMATVQFWKVFFHPRSAFHRAQLYQELGSETVNILGLIQSQPAKPATSAPEADKAAEWDLVYDRSNLSEFASLLDNPTEVLMGQIRSAADFIMVRPSGFEGALRALAGAPGTKAVGEYLDFIKEESTAASEPTDESIESQATRMNTALFAVRFFVEQRLNLLHIKLRDRWRRRVRLLASVTAGGTGLLVIVAADLGPLAKISALFAAIVWGGFFAWLARDVVALVERRRT